MAAWRSLSVTCMHACCPYDPHLLHPCCSLCHRPNGAALLSDPDLPAVINVHISTGAFLMAGVWAGPRLEDQSAS